MKGSLHEDLRIFMKISRSILLTVRKCLDKRLEDIKTHYTSTLITNLIH